MCCFVFFIYANLIRLAYPSAGVAQSAEHVLGKDGVTGSIPVSSFVVGLSFLGVVKRNARDNNFRMHRLQEPELYGYKK